MTSFVVLQHDDEPTARAAEKTVFVRDAFSIVALAFPIFWLFWHRLWLMGVGALLLFAAVGIFSAQNPEFLWILIVLNVILPLVVAIEGSEWRMVALRFSGYKDVAVVDAENLEQAQLKWALLDHTHRSRPTEKPSETRALPLKSDLIFGADGLG